jgi:two-component system, NtrC family, sensor histidine kinase PilS
VGTRDEISRSLWLSALYRLFVALLLLWLGTLAPGYLALVPAAPATYLFAAASYLALALVLAMLARNTTGAGPALLGYQVVGGALADIIAISLVLLTTGGVATGLGLLLIPAIAATATMTSGRISLFMAALATLMVLITELIIGPALPGPFEPSPTQAGLLGAILFVAVLLTWRLAQRAGSSEAQLASTESDLANLSELNAQIIERMGAGVIAVDPEGRIRSLNEAARSLLPVRTRARTLHGLSPRLAEMLEDWQADSGEPSTRQLAGDAEHTELQVRLAPLGTGGEQGTLLILENAAEIKRRAHAAKLQSIGRLTASIAHEIRNPLGAISHSAQLLAESPELAAGDKRLLDIIQRQSQRVDGVIRNILGMSRGEPARRELLRLDEPLERFAEEFCGSLHIPRTAVQISVQPRDSHVRFDPSHLRQVLWNLCMNARLHAGHDRPGSPPIVLRGGTEPMHHRVTLDVIDSGPGVPPEELEGLFEPFSSRSPEGTGLGLYVSRLLCENNGAALEYLEQPQGGCFRILFPLREYGTAEAASTEPPGTLDR